MKTANTKLTGIQFDGATAVMQMDEALGPATATSRYLPFSSERSYFFGEEQQPGLDLPDSQDVMRVPQFVG